MKRVLLALVVGLGLVSGTGSAVAGSGVIGTVNVGVGGGYPGHWHGGYWRGGYRPYWRSGWAIGLGVDLYPYPAYPAYSYPYPGYVVVPPPAYYESYAYQAPPPPRSQPARRDPQFAPRFGQNAWQTEADLQSCNRWATTQPEAMADAAEFHRKSLACMEGRGYEVKQ